MTAATLVHRACATVSLLLLALVGQACASDTPAITAPPQQSGLTSTLARYNALRADPNSIGKQHNNLLMELRGVVKARVRANANAPLTKAQTCRAFLRFLKQSNVTESDQVILRTILQSNDRNCKLSERLSMSSSAPAPRALSAARDDSEGLDPVMWAIFDTLTWNENWSTMPTVNESLARYDTVLGAVQAAIANNTTSTAINTAVVAAIANANFAEDYEADLFAALGDVATSSSTYWEQNGQAWFNDYMGNGGGEEPPCDWEVEDCTELPQGIQMESINRSSLSLLGRPSWNWRSALWGDVETVCTPLAVAATLYSMGHTAVDISMEGLGTATMRENTMFRRAVMHEAGSGASKEAIARTAGKLVGRAIMATSVIGVAIGSGLAGIEW